MKYHNKKVELHGIKFDSKKEMNRYRELKLLEKAGLIRNLELQPAFLLIPAFKKNGKAYRKTEYIADFKYFDIEKDKWIIEDTKGFRTDVYKLKKKMFEWENEDLEIKEI